MWATLEAHKPRRSYAKAWATMLKERTYDAARAAYCAAPAGSAAWRATAAAASALWADQYAQRAIDAIKEVKP
jgi:hypothetical protein